MSRQQNPPPRFLSPRYWPVWLSIGLLNLWSLLPWGGQWQVARLLGWLSYHLARRRRHIVEVNLRLCFPEWDKKLRDKHVRQVLFNNLLGLVETTNAYRRPLSQLPYRVQIHNPDALRQAQAQGRGVLLLGAHFSHLDLGGLLMSSLCEPCAIYRPNNNPLFDRYIQQGRQKFMKGVIERTDMRAIARALKRNEVVWYPPDQDYGRSHSVYAPFFGVNAATITATSRLVRFNQSPVVMMACWRDDSTRTYHLELRPGPEGFPSGDDVEDARLINAALEQSIRRAPTQYMWTHRRFKTQPDGRGNLYR